MKVVLQRVTSASVNVDKNLISKIDHGLLLLWGIEKGDTFEDIETLTKKILKLRICLLYTSPSPRDTTASRMPSSA